jgi:hypothetical protein
MKPHPGDAFFQRLADLMEQEKKPLAVIDTLNVGEHHILVAWDIENVSAILCYYSDLAMHVSYSKSISVRGHGLRTVLLPSPVHVCAGCAGNCGSMHEPSLPGIGPLFSVNLEVLS